jgi:hypothetical protein
MENPVTPIIGIKNILCEIFSLDINVIVIIFVSISILISTIDIWPSLA